MKNNDDYRLTDEQEELMRILKSKITSEEDKESVFTIMLIATDSAVFLKEAYKYIGDNPNATIDEINIYLGGFLPEMEIIDEE